MPDEPIQPVAAPEPVSEPAPAAPPAPAGPDLGELNRKVDALVDVVKTTMQTRQAPLSPQAPPVPPGQIPTAEREFLRSRGLTDAEIDGTVGPLVRPFVEAALRQVAPDILGLVGAVKDDVEVVKAQRNTKEYPHWELLADEITKLRDSAKQGGQYLDPKRAYEAALALNIDKVVEHRQAERTRSAAADANAQHVRNVGGRATGGTSGPKTREELRAMSKEDRAKYFDSIGNLPIQ